MMAASPLTNEDAAGLLRSGGVMLMGTDTLPGFHCRADLDSAVERIVALKGRQAGKSLVVLAGSMSQALLVSGPLEKRQVDFCQKCWPGPFSLILPAGGNLSGPVVSPQGTVAVRVPAVPSLRAVLLAVGFPLVSTSANLSGHPPHGDLREAWAEFGQNVDGLWQPPSNKEDEINDTDIRPSCLVNLAVWPPEVLRQGPLAPPSAD